MAVPIPSPTDPAAQEPNPSVEPMKAMARAWTHMPARINRLRPHLSDSTPVTSCPSPHTAG